MKLRIGVIGVGGLGHLQTKTYDDIEDVVVVGAADVSDAARTHFEDVFGVPAYEHYRDLLSKHADELDAVTIVTPHTLHYEQAMACLQRGIHVLLEKPMVTDVGHAVDLVETAAERDVVLQVGYQRHFHPAFEEIRRVIGSGRIGELHAVNCYLGQDWIDPHRDTWRADPDLSGGGQLYDTGSHLLDVLLWTTEAVPATVSAQFEYVAPAVDVNCALALELDRDDDTIIGSVGISGDGVDISPSEGYFYWGTRGRVTYTDAGLTVAEKDGMTYQAEVTGGADFQSLNLRKLENFIDSINGTAEPAVPGEFGLQVTALTEAAYMADDESCRVDVQRLIEDEYADRHPGTDGADVVR